MEAYAHPNKDVDGHIVDSDDVALFERGWLDMNDLLRDKVRLGMRKNRQVAFPRRSAKPQKIRRGAVTSRVAALLRSSGAGRWEP